MPRTNRFISHKGRDEQSPLLMTMNSTILTLGLAGYIALTAATLLLCDDAIANVAADSHRQVHPASSSSLSSSLRRREQQVQGRQEAFLQCMESSAASNEEDETSGSTAEQPSSSFRWVQVLHGLNHYWEKFDEEKRPRRVKQFKEQLDGARKTAKMDGIPSLFVGLGVRPTLRDITSNHTTIQSISNDMLMDACALGLFEGNTKQASQKRSMSPSLSPLKDILDGADFPYLSVSPTEELGDLIDPFNSIDRSLMEGADGRLCNESKGKVVGSCFLEISTSDDNSNSNSNNNNNNVSPPTKVGIIGLSQRDYLVKKPVEQVRKQVKILEESSGVDIIVLLSRNGEIGLDPGLLTGVDIILWESQRDMNAPGADPELVDEALSTYPLIRYDAEGFPVVVVAGSPKDGSILGNLMVKFDKEGHVVSTDSRSGRRYFNDGPMTPPIGIDVNSVRSVSSNGHQWLEILHDMNSSWQKNNPVSNPNGIPRYYSLVEHLKASTDEESIPSLHVSLGHQGLSSQGQTLSNDFLHTLYATMGVDAVVAGSNTSPRVAKNGTQLLSTALVNDPQTCGQTSNLLTGSCTIDVGCHKVGMIGISDDPAELPTEVLVISHIESLTNSGVDVIIVMDQRVDSMIDPKKFIGVDIILTNTPGNQYLEMISGANGFPTLIVRSSTKDSDILGSLIVKFDSEGHVVSTDSRSRRFSEADSLQLSENIFNEDIFTIIEDNLPMTSRRRILGKTIYPLNGEMKEKNIQETNLGRLLVDSIKEAAESVAGPIDITLYQADSMLGSIPGPYITREEIKDEKIYVVNCDASHILAAINNGFFDYWSDSGRFLQVDGVRVQYDPLFFGQDNLEQFDWDKPSWATFSVKVEKADGTTEDLVEYFNPTGDPLRRFTVATTETVVENFASIASCRKVNNTSPIPSTSVSKALRQHLSTDDTVSIVDPPTEVWITRMPFLWDALELDFNVFPEVYFVEETNPLDSSLIWKTFGHGESDCNYQELSFGNEVLPVNIENLIDHGTHRLLLRFSTWIVNFGPDSMYYGWPPEYVWQKKYFPDLTTCYDYDKVECHFEWGPCHGHWHNKEQTYYELFAKEEDGTRSGVSVVGRKQAFCMVDSGVYPATTNATAFSNDREFMGCELFGEAGIQGISAGWFDNYSYDLPGQWVDVTGVPAGEYDLCVTVNAGRIIRESNLDDNTSCRTITIPHSSIDPPDQDNCSAVGDMCEKAGDSQCCNGHCVETSMGDNSFCECVPERGNCWKDSDCCGPSTQNVDVACVFVDGYPLKQCQHRNTTATTAGSGFFGVP